MAKDWAASSEISARRMLNEIGLEIEGLEFWSCNYAFEYKMETTSCKITTAAIENMKLLLE